MPGGGEKPSGEKKEEKKEDAEKTDESGEDKEKKPEEKKDEGPPTIHRPLQAQQPAKWSATEPNDEGKIKFSFKGQPWPTVLEWLADVSNMSLEWEEAPAGYLDFTTRGEYTPEQIRDLLNSVLLNKGFTLLRNGEVLIVANVRRLDPGLVPRLRPDELEDRGTFELARVFFDLDWLVAEEAAKEVTPLVNSFGKVTPLKATNRLDVLDTVGNLRRIRDLLLEEQSSSGQQRLVREFKLRYTRAEEVLDTLNTLLGIEPKQQGAANVDPRQMMQAMMMAQQMGGQGAALAGGKKENSVFLAVNSRENSILVNAPPDKMGVIAQAIEAVDVPAARGGGILANAQRVKVYRLSGLAPDTLAKVLKELGSLDPTTKLEVDTKKNALVAYAPLADHVMIGELVERLDGTSRKFEVVQLRTLSAEYVAGSIMTLMNGPEKKTDNSSRNRWNYYDSAPEQSSDTDKFWVEADLERNRLLLRANEVELAEVKALLVKLGELPIDPRGAVTMRVVPFVPDGDTLETLETEVKPTFEASGHELRMNPSDFKQPTRKTAPVEEAPPSRRRAPSATRTPSASHETRSSKPQLSRYRLAQDRRVIDTAEEDSASDSESDADDSTESTADAADTPEDVGAGADADTGDDERDGDVKASDQASDDDSEIADTDGEDADEMTAESSDDAEAQPLEKHSGDDDDDVVDADEPNDAERRFQETHPRDLNPDDLPRSARAPVKITVGPQGLVISSSDPEALDQLEELLNRMLPRRANFKLFTLKHTYAKDMVSLLKDVFKADLDKESSRTEVFDMFWNGRGSSSSSQSSRASLSRRRPLNFVADPVTNTVLVQGADTAQLAEVEALIERYDRAEPPNSESVRRTRHVPLKYAKAKEVADVLKDVYRDLLSPNDKALLQNQPQQPQQQKQNDNFYSAMFSYLTDDPTKSEIVPRFKGMLSVGVDERANGVVVSAPQIILTEVLKMVDDLDRSARPSRPVVRIMRVKSPGVANEVRQAVMGKKAAEAAAANGTTPPTTVIETAPAATNQQRQRGGFGGGR